MYYVPTQDIDIAVIIYYSFIIKGGVTIDHRRITVYSSQIGSFTQKELERIMEERDKLEIAVRQNPKRNRLPLKLRRKETRRKERGRREYCCYVADLTETTIRSMMILIKVNISNIHWIEIYQ